MAEAYGSRGLLSYELGNQPEALEDLQKAAQLFDQQGDRDAYQQTLDLIQQVQQP
jgi:tetratricopeptide (TPR) repeat protein